MKKILLILMVLPAICFAQVKKTTKTSTKGKTVVKAADAKVAGGFVINGDITGFADGTQVFFVNDQTNALEPQATFNKGKFTIKGKMDEPGFKVMVFGNNEGSAPLFLDNSTVKITGEKSGLDHLVVTGSATHSDFMRFTNALKPYEKVFLPDAPFDSVAYNNALSVSEDFIRKNPNSYIAPLAFIRYMQVSEDQSKGDELFKLMSSQVRSGSLGNYAAQTLAESKINPIGSLLPEFSQTDTIGKSVSINSFRGKYVLLDFWASWCRPCRQENPNVVAAHDKYQSRNFTILGISLDQAKPAWLDAIKMDGLHWTQVSDLKGWNNSVAAQFQIRSIPQNLLIDPTGRIIAKNLRGPALYRKLDAVLK